MTFDDVFSNLSGKFGKAILEKGETKPDPYIKVEPSQIREIVRYLRDELKFETVGNLGGVDYPTQSTLVVVYHLTSYTHKLVVALKVFLPRPQTATEMVKIPSIASLYNAADWLERETYDMFGIDFEGHPDQRRILMPNDWVGYPLRKDFVTPDYYNGMPVPLYFDDQAAAGAPGKAEN